jgi:hypothetical protein
MLRYERGWAFEHSIDCAVTTEFAWSFWTNVSNRVIDADVESVEIYGPFAAGARGFTNRQKLWPGGMGRFVWTFEESGGCTRITQRCTLVGEQADTYAKAVGPTLETGIPAGTQRASLQPN